MTLEELKKNYARAATSGNTERAVYLAKQIREMEIVESREMFRGTTKERSDAVRNTPEALGAKLKAQLEKSKLARKDGNKKLADEHAAAAKETANKLEIAKKLQKK